MDKMMVRPWGRRCEFCPPQEVSVYKSRHVNAFKNSHSKHSLVSLVEFSSVRPYRFLIDRYSLWLIEQVNRLRSHCRSYLPFNHFLKISPNLQIKWYFQENFCRASKLSLLLIVFLDIVWDPNFWFILDDLSIIYLVDLFLYQQAL